MLCMYCTVESNSKIRQWSEIWIAGVAQPAAGKVEYQITKGDICIIGLINPSYMLLWKDT